jgi:deoxyxylulose-5-phosphate synthase
MSERYDCRDAFAGALEELAQRDPRVVVVVNDSVGSSKVGNFRKRFPGRLINVGIAEQNMCARPRVFLPGARWNKSKPIWLTLKRTSNCAA